ncbi:hypothetical protein [Gemmatimonas sp.]
MSTTVDNSDTKLTASILPSMFPVHGEAFQLNGELILTTSVLHRLA